MVPDFYDNQTMKPVEFSKLPAFLAKFPVDKARTASQPLCQRFAVFLLICMGSSTNTLCYLLCMAGPAVPCAKHA